MNPRFISQELSIAMRTWGVENPDEAIEHFRDRILEGVSTGTGTLDGTLSGLPVPVVPHFTIGHTPTFLPFIARLAQTSYPWPIHSPSADLPKILPTTFLSYLMSCLARLWVIDVPMVCLCSYLTSSGWPWKGPIPFLSQFRPVPPLCHPAWKRVRASTYSG
jgi:hypothetical protein